MAEIQKKFGKYNVTLDNNMGDGATGCWIEYRNFSASLEAADADGVLVDSSRDTEHTIESRLIDEIREWADANGY